MSLYVISLMALKKAEHVARLGFYLITSSSVNVELIWVRLIICAIISAFNEVTMAHRAPVAPCMYSVTQYE